ncbi:MAG TPA: glycosyltransferase family 39 protein [Burkholderiaceae bacterium]|nr:glycosyltransferase family 39 protein [Burkholderiaceae bacterium]
MNAALDRSIPGESPTGAYAVAFLLVALALACWARPLMLPDEGRYVGVAWEMLRTGNWLTPTLDGLPFFHKPPLFYWITAASMWAFGANELAARAAPLLGLLIAVVALRAFTRRWANEQQAKLAVVALVAQPLFLCAGQYANLDMLVAGLISATILLLADVVLSADRGAQRHGVLLAAYAAAALGVLAKGLIGAVIPALVVATWLVWTRRWRAFATLFSWAGMAIFIALAAPWFIAMQLRFDDFFDYFFVVQHFKRFAESGFNNVQPIWFFAALLFVLCLPWLPWLYRQIATAARRSGDPGVRQLAWLWAAAVLVFFSIPQSKIVGYILPALPPLAWLIADGYAADRAPNAQARWLWWGAAAFGISVSLVAAVVLTVAPRGSARDLARELLARRGPNEPVLMLNRFDFDVPFYARLRDPVVVIDDWSSAEVQKQDNWRRELADGAGFDPRAAAGVLLEPRDLPAVLCRAPVAWVIGAPDQVKQLPATAIASAVFNTKDASLWRVTRAGPGARPPASCAEPANSAPAQM